MTRGSTLVAFVRGGVGHANHLTPDRFIVGLPAVQVFLLVSEQCQWFGFNEKKGWTARLLA
jgi:hypothetical protein